MGNRVIVDVDALYGKALGRLGDVGRFLDELRQLRASKGNGKSLAAAQEPDEDTAPDDEDTEDEDEVTARCLPVDDR